MKILKISILSVLVLFFLSTAMNGVLFGQEATPDQKDMQKKMEELMTPGPNHKYLEYFAGPWTIVVQTWMQPGAEPMVAKGETDGVMILGGRYLQYKMTGSMMGMPYEGVNISGYNNFKKEFFSVWLDNFGTGLYDTYGTLDATGKIRTETGIWDDPTTGGKSKVKLVDAIVDNDKHIFTMYMVSPDGTEFKYMVIEYTRKK